MNSGKTFIFYFSNYFVFYGRILIFEKHYFAVFFNHPIVTNNSANMHLKENKISYFSPFGPRDRMLGSANNIKKKMSVRMCVYVYRNISGTTR
ncbi:hypothetical protein TSAR_009437 [Trichomalopsis sarcophagae]|uniref:Uncharacterized protein n=1 Tax=Trichomalopsis sarcophagae TaxID=543379 RepID=A0A232EHH5_9HYME|nr:hypothetical protein TSAR_009437 [Trichomalopsis sarcophagae]